MLQSQDLVYLAEWILRGWRIFYLVHNIFRDNPAVNALARHSFLQLYLGYLKISGGRICIVKDTLDALDAPVHKDLLKRTHIAIMTLNDLINSASAILI